MPNPANHPDRINAEVRAILDDCMNARDPLAVFSDHIRRLSADRSWDEKGVADVEHATLQMLLAMLGRDHPGK